MYPVISKGLVVHKIPGGAIIVSPGTFHSLKVHQSDLDLLLLCDGTKTVDDIAQVHFTELNYSCAKLSVSRAIAKYHKNGFLLLHDGYSSAVAVRVTGDDKIEYPLCESIRINEARFGSFGIKNMNADIYHNQIGRLASLGTLSVTLTGKEPLQHPGFVAFLHAACEIFPFVVFKSKLKDLIAFWPAKFKG